MPHLKWEQQYLGESLGNYVKRHCDQFWRHWIVEIDAQTQCTLNGLELDRKFGRPNRVRDAPRSYRIWFQNEDGSRKQAPGVFFPDIGAWRKKRLGEWIAIGKRIDFWLILEDAGCIQKNQARESRFRKLSEQIGQYVDDNGPEPDDDIDLAMAIPAEEQAIMDQAQAAFDQEAHRVIDEAIDNYLHKHFPATDWQGVRNLVEKRYEPKQPT